jgi:ubiquitin C-terminal hydrolase
MGSIANGHYTSFCNRENEPDKWLLFNDDEVMEINEDADSAVVTQNAYILFYKRRNISNSALVFQDIN